MKCPGISSNAMSFINITSSEQISLHSYLVAFNTKDVTSIAKWSNVGYATSQTIRGTYLDADGTTTYTTLNCAYPSDPYYTVDKTHDILFLGLGIDYGMDASMSFVL